MNLNDIIKLYEEGVSIGKIAKQYNSYPSKIYKLLKDSNVKIRSKSEAQKQLLDTGQVTHPTEGKGHTDKTKNKISSTVFNKWTNKSDEEKEEYRKIAKARWDKMSQSDKDKINEKASKAIRATTTGGSKLEHFLLKVLTEVGYIVIPHRKDFLPNTKLEVDLLLPGIKTAIEVDGPSHFMPVWGEAELERTQKSDQEKNGLLLHYGYKVVRLRYTGKHFALAHQNLILDKLLPLLKGITDGKIKDKLHIIEVLC